MLDDRVPFANFNEILPDPAAFEYKIMSRICQIHGWSCSFVPIRSLNDRINWLNSGKVDVVIAKFSVTQERAYKVRFVFPYYYADSVAVFELQGNIEAGESGELAGPICLEEGYYLDKEIKAHGFEDILYKKG